MNGKEFSVLLGCGLFQNMPAEDARGLLACLSAEEVHYEKNQVIWHIGDPIRACALVLSGAVRAETLNAAGEHALAAYHTGGSLVGDVLMATPGGVSPVCVIAAEDATLLFLPYQGIMGGCERNCPRHTRLRENLLSEIARKFWAQRRRTGYLTARSLRQRIAMYLADRSAEGGATFSLGSTRENLADFLGVNRSALCRELSRMKAEGILDYYRDTFRILDMEALSRYRL